MGNQKYKQIALERLKGHWGISIGVAAIAALLGGLLTGNRFLPDVDMEGLSSVFQYTARFGDQWTVNISLIELAVSILSGVLELGYAKFLLKQYDGNTYEFKDLFSEFDRFGTGIVQAFLRALYVALWSLLLIIPGIIAGYSYAMTPFILSENPDMTASEAITRSKQMMDGHKGDLFLLDISFFGWAILAMLTFNIGNLWLNPYRNAAYAAFYRNLATQPEM